MPILKRWLASWCVLLAGSAHAAVECDPDFPDRCSAPIEAGAPAPYAGQVLTTELAKTLGQKASAAAARQALAVRTATRAAAVDHRYQLDLVAADTRACEQRELVQQDRAERAEQAVKDAEPGVLDHPLFWALIGVSVMAGAFALAAGEIKGLK